MLFTKIQEYTCVYTNTYIVLLELNGPSSSLGLFSSLFQVELYIRGYQYWVMGGYFWIYGHEWCKIYSVYSWQILYAFLLCFSSETVNVVSVNSVNLNRVHIYRILGNVFNKANTNISYLFLRYFMHSQ